LPSEAWDRSRALESVGGDEEFLAEIADIFRAACPTLLKSLEDSIASKNYLSGADTAKLLGRAAKNLAATRVTEAARAVEMMIRNNEIDDIVNACYALQQEIGRLMDALADFRSGRP
jgi:HPt (histidine-containing phosphotransfer) domain-containing protein